MQKEKKPKVNTDEHYEPTYKEYVEIMWMRLSPQLKEISDFAEIAADYVDHLRDE